MAVTASQAKSGLNDISSDIRAFRSQLNQVQALAANSANGLEGMPAKWGSLITEINQAAAQFPNDEALKTYKAEAALLQNEFNALLAKAQQFETAVTGISF